MSKPRYKKPYNNSDKTHCEMCGVRFPKTMGSIKYSGNIWLCLDCDIDEYRISRGKKLSTGKTNSLFDGVL